MRSGLWRSLSGLLSAAAFAVGVASPVQFCPCPAHGAALPAHLSHVDHAHAAADMPMPAADADAATPVPHSGHGGDSSSPHAAHKCTCPGGCCATTPVALFGHTLQVATELLVAPRATMAVPTDSVELAESPQLALPFANAPPAFRSTLHSAAQHTT